MPRKSIAKTLLCPVSLGSVFSYELRGNQIIVRLLGLVPVRRIHLSKVRYLRLATRSEVSPLYLLFNWAQFTSRRRAVRPVYILQTRKRYRIFLKLDGSAHFKLRQAIGRNNTGNHRKAA